MKNIMNLKCSKVIKGIIEDNKILDLSIEEYEDRLSQI